MATESIVGFLTQLAEGLTHLSAVTGLTPFKSAVANLVMSDLAVVHSAVASGFDLVAIAPDASWFQILLEWFKNPETLLLALGKWVLLGVALIVFIESGVLFPVLPGDSLVFSAGLLHSRLGLSLWMLILTIVVCAMAGSQVGYWIGEKFGRKLFSDDARFLKTEHLVKSEEFFAQYGGRSLVMGRFVPFVRTFVPIAAGMAGYSRTRFAMWNLVGALLWGGGLTLLGSALGGISFIHDNLSAIILLIVFASVLPMVVEYFLHKRRAQTTPEETPTGA